MVFFSWKTHHLKGNRKILRDWSFLGEFGKGHSRQDSTPAQRGNQTREMLQALDLLTHRTQGTNREELFSAGFQQVQHQQDAKSKLQGNSGMIPGEVGDGSGSSHKCFNWRKEQMRTLLPTKTGTRATSHNMLVPL